MGYLMLAGAILVEVIGTSLMPRTDGFRSLPWTALVLGCYAMSFFLLAQVVQTVPVYIAYAVWAGAGTLLVAAVGILILKEPTSAVRLAGLALVVVGLVLTNWALPQTTAAGAASDDAATKQT